MSYDRHTGGRGERGEAGRPGEPGEPGTGTGGPGGAGGAGGRGGRGGHTWRWGPVALTAACVVVTTLSALALYNSNRIADLQTTYQHLQHVVNVQQAAAIKRGREVDYDQCLRAQVTRAALNVNALADGVTARIAPSNRQGILFTLYDCTPNLQGQSARQLTPAQAAALQHYVKTTKNLP